MEDCIFCKIIKGEIPSTKAYEDDEILIFNDISPICTNHYIMILKEHFGTIKEMDERRAEMLGKALLKLNNLEKELHLENGYRLIINQGEDAGQTVHHLHIHILSGKKMAWDKV